MDHSQVSSAAVASEGSSGVVVKVSAILGAFRQEHRQLGLNELSRRTGLPKATVFRLASEMTRCGLLSRSGTDYALGPRLFELAQLVPGRRDLREAALPFLEDVYVATRETVHLAILEGVEVVYIERLAGHRSGATPSAVAGRLPAHCTATGKALLAHAGIENTDRVIAAGLTPRTPFTIVLADVLRRELERVRHARFAVEREETRLGFASVASPVFSGDNRVVAAISVTVPIGRLDVERLAATVCVAARGLTRSLGSSVDEG